MDIRVWNIRDWATSKHKSVDDRPFGGGPGMVLMPEPVYDAVDSVQGQADPGLLIMLTPGGERLTQQVVQELATHKRLMLLCGRYEGFDERIRLGLKPREISIGDFICNGGEVPAMVVIDTVIRYVPGVLGDEESVTDESHSEPGRLEYPQYTRPRVFRGMEVPEILLSGNHPAIAAWRKGTIGTTKQAKQPPKPGDRRSPMKNKFIAKVEEADIKKEVPEFEIGDQVDVHQKILEGEKERTQVFSGLVISRKGEGMARDVHGAAHRPERRRRTHLSAALAEDRQGRSETHWSGAPRQAVLPARPRRQGSDSSARTQEEAEGRGAGNTRDPGESAGDGSAEVTRTVPCSH